jgi:carboxylesterase
MEGMTSVSRARLVFRWLARVCLIVGVALVGMNCAGSRAARGHDVPRDPATGIMAGAEPIVIDRGRDRAAVLLHGWLTTPADFGELPAVLDRAGWDVYAPLQAGHGTRPIDLEGLTADDLLSAARGNYRAVRARYSTVALCGFSMGGAVATLLAAEEPPDALVLIAPFYGVRHKWYYVLPAATWNRVLTPVVKYVKRSRSLLRVNRPEGRGEIIAYAAFPTAATTALFKLRDRIADDDCAAKLTMPLLLTYSEGDQVCDPAAMERMYGAAPSPSKRKAVFERSNHHLLHDYDRQEAIEAILDFLAEVGG